MSEMIYLDNAATTRIDDEVLETMLPYMKELYSNPSGSYGFASKARAAVQRARVRAAQLIGAEPDEIYFTSGGTEADNTAIRCAAAAHGNKGGIVISGYEHPAILNTAEDVASDTGITLKKLKPDTEGCISGSQIDECAAGNDFLASIMMANNEIGTVNDIAAIGERAHEHGMLMHTDAVQAFGRIHIDVKAMNIDMLSASSHKIHGPKGVGILYIRRGLRLPAYLTGGGQESGMRSGTENVAGIAGFGKACETALRDMEKDNVRMSELRDYLTDRILHEIPDTILTGTADTGKRLPGHASFAFGGIEGASLLIKLDVMGICASTGSACSASSKEPSHVLRAIGVPMKYINGSLRLTLSKYNTGQEAERAVLAIAKAVGELREMRL